MNFKELLQQSIKSEDTEEWLDKVFTRPVGLAFALLWRRLGVHPNTITILSIILGVAAAWMFYYTDWQHNLCGVVLLMFANFCDSTDGQLARLTNQKSFVGRVLDGLAGDVWFFCIYAVLCFRLMPQEIPFTSVKWGLWIWPIAYVAGIVCHTNQSSLADYYRQIHLFFLKGKEGSELDNSRQQIEVLRTLPRDNCLGRFFYSNYARYCRNQERRTPRFQAFFRQFKTRGDDANDASEGTWRTALKEESRVEETFLEGSRPLMKYTNILTFNCRAIVLYATCLLNVPYVFFLFDLTVFHLIYIYMHHRHEALCERLTTE